MEDDIAPYALVEERPHHVEEHVEDPGIVDNMDPAEPEGKAAGEEGSDAPDLVDTEVADVLEREPVDVSNDRHSCYLCLHLSCNKLKENIG